MDKPSERKRDTKECGDTDVGVQDYGAGGKREQINGLWGVASEKVLGLPPERMITGCYTKRDDGKHKKLDLVDIIMTSGPPALNTSKPKRIF